MSLPPSSLPPCKRGSTYCRQKRNIEESADQNHHLENKKRGSQAGQTQVRDPGCTPRPLPQSCTTSSHTRDPEGKGLKPGAASHRLHCRAVRLARVLQIQHSPAETVSDTRRCTEIRLLTRRRSPTKGWDGGLTMMFRLTSNVQSSCLSLLRARTTDLHHDNPLSFHYYKLSIVKFIYVNFQKYGSGRMKWNQKCIFGKSIPKNFVLLAFRLFVLQFCFVLRNLMYL